MHVKRASFKKAEIIKGENILAQVKTIDLRQAVPGLQNWRVTGVLFNDQGEILRDKNGNSISLTEKDVEGKALTAFVNPNHPKHMGVIIDDQVYYVHIRNRAGLLGKDVESRLQQTPQPGDRILDTASLKIGSIKSHMMVEEAPPARRNAFARDPRDAAARARDPALQKLGDMLANPQKHAVRTEPVQVPAGKIQGNSYVLSQDDIAQFGKGRIRAIGGQTSLSTIGGDMNTSLSEIMTENGKPRTFDGMRYALGQADSIIRNKEFTEKLATAGNVSITKKIEVTGEEKTAIYRIKFDNQYVDVEDKYIPGQLKGALEGLKAEQTFNAPKYHKALQQVSGPSVLAEAAAHPSPKAPESPMLHFGNNSPGRGLPDNSLAGQLSGALNGKRDTQNPPTITIPEPLKNLGEKIGRGSDDMGAAVQEQLQGRAEQMHAQLEGVVKQGGSPAEMLGNIFTKVMPGFLTFTRGAAETAGRQVKSAEEGIGAEVRGAKAPLQEAANPLQRLGEQLRRTMSGDGEKPPTEERRYLKPEEGLPWAKQPQQPKAEQPPLPQGRPERNHPDQNRAEAPKVMPTAPVAPVARETLAAPQGAKVAPDPVEKTAAKPAGGSTSHTSADGLAMTWKKGNPVEPYDLKVQEMQLALAKIDPKYEKIMTYTNRAGEKVFADGLKAGLTTRAMAEYAKDFGLNPKTLKLGDIVNHGTAMASMLPALDEELQNRYPLSEKGVLPAQFAQAADGPQNMPRSPAPALAVDNSLDKIIQDGQKMQFSSMG